MQRVNEFHFYNLARHIHKLTALSGTVKYSEVFVDWFQARTTLNQMFTYRPLTVTLAAGSDLYNAITELVPEDWNEAVAKLNDKNQDIPYWQHSKISEAAQKFETVLEAESQVLDTYFVSKKGAYSTVDLVERAHTAFGPIGSKLPKQAISDFDQAGKCIAFDLPTSAAFHATRGTEAVIRKYYELLTGKAPKTKMRNWGAYIKRLRECNADTKVASFLDHIREAYRNPVLHPEENIDPDQALILFNACISVVVLMLGEIERLAEKSAPLQFPAATMILTGASSDAAKSGV